MSLLLAMVGWGVACGDDEAFQQAEDPAEAECPCRLATQIDNLALCVSPTTAFAPTHVYSSFWNAVSQRPECEPWRDPQPLPATPWSAVRVSSECVGSAQLCVTVKAGVATSISADDCVPRHPLPRVQLHHARGRRRAGAAR